MNNNYDIQRNIDHLNNYGYTFFLDGLLQKQVKNKIKKDYDIYYVYPDCDKVIYYYQLPEISLIEIITNNNLRHQDILGALLNLGIYCNYLGDMVIINNHYYFYIFNTIKEFILLNLDKIGKYKVELKEIDLDYLNNYEKQYEEINIIVNSERIDSILSRIINTNRDTIKEKIKNKEVILNYEVLTSTSKLLKENDIFSIKRYGKYKYIGIINSTKKGHLVIKCKKYL